jgi:hypothetical protein
MAKNVGTTLTSLSPGDEIHLGDRFAGFVVISLPSGEESDRRMHHLTWRCEQCRCTTVGFRTGWWMREHDQRGHSACEYCGKLLPNLKDGSPRRHRFNKCPNKDESHRVIVAMAKDLAAEGNKPRASKWLQIIGKGK